MSEVRYAGFWIRVVAEVIDDVILGVASMGIAYAVLYLGFLVFHPAPTFGLSFSGGTIQIILLGANLFASFPYYVWFHYRYGATPGKRVLGIRVRDAETLNAISLKQSFIRFGGYLLSALLFAAGYVMAAFNPRKQGLLDVLAGTVCIRVTGASAAGRSEAGT